MAQLKQLRFNPDDPKSVAEALTELQRVVGGELSLGDPLDPNDDQSVVLAGGTGLGTHNGRPGNLFGSWVELEFDASDVEIVAVHNLDTPVFNNEVNVRWLVAGVRHSGAGTGALDIEHQDGDTLTLDTIGLRCQAGAGRTIDGANPVRVTLFFVPATRWPD